MTSRMHVVVRGRVQGVGFRWFVREEARSLGLSGWVLNRPDGAVEIEASGGAEALAQLRQRVAEGPPAAQVQEVEELPPGGDAQLPSPFSVRR